MIHELQTPLSTTEAAELAKHYLFERVEYDGNVFISFSSATARDAAALEIRNRRMQKHPQTT